MKRDTETEAKEGTMKSERIEGYGTVMGSISWDERERVWNILDAGGNHIQSISSSSMEDRAGRLFDPDLAVTADDILMLARTVYPSAVRVHPADEMMDAGVIPNDGTRGAVILG